MKGQGFSIKLNGIIGFVFLVSILVLLFFVAKGIFSVLTMIAPVLIVLALIINYKTVVNYLRFVLGLLRRNLLGGIITIILSVVGFPILSGVLFGKAILDRKVKRLQQAHEANERGEEVDYEEVIRPEREDSLKLPNLEKPKPEVKENPYKDLF
jgi:hypothetical protein